MVAQPLQGREVLAAAGAVVAIYGGGLFSLHRWAAVPPASASTLDEKQAGFWGTLPSAWDHPEPNYVVSGVVGEFWSVLTTIPVAGALLLYQGVRFGYGRKVMAIYALTCGMYSFAFAAHLTLQMHIFSTTVIAVMSNALLTFAMFSHVVHWALASNVVRGAIVVISEIILVGTVATLPYALEHGGVWTLFTVQSPGVFLATFLAAAMASKATCQKERTTYRLVGASGSLLSAAMVLSLVECLIGFERGYLDDFWGFPWLHIAIHVLEQVGIYVFGVGVAALQALLLSPENFEGAEVRTAAGLVYLYCPRPAGAARLLCGAEQPVAAASEIVLDGDGVAVCERSALAADAEGKLSGDAAAAGERSQQAQRGHDSSKLAAGGMDKAEVGRLPPSTAAILPQEFKQETSLQRRKRTQSPGVSGLVARSVLKESC